MQNHKIKLIPYGLRVTVYGLRHEKLKLHLTRCLARHTHEHVQLKYMYVYLNTLSIYLSISRERSVLLSSGGSLNGWLTIFVLLHSAHSCLSSSSPLELMF